MNEATIPEVMTFHPAQWSELCVRLAAQASRNCGLVHDMYQQLFSDLVDQRFRTIPVEHHPAALEIAYRWDYLDPEGRAKAQQDMAEQGYCTHGLDPKVCPMGCGDLSWFEPEEPDHV